MVNMFVVRASARIPGTRYGLKAALQTPHFIRLKCYDFGFVLQNRMDSMWGGRPACRPGLRIGFVSQNRSRPADPQVQVGRLSEAEGPISYVTVSFQ